jgi:putative oxidoreductase
LGMTGIIQLTEPDGWANFHLPWAAMALALITWGGGPLSLDALISRLSPSRKAPQPGRVH